MGLDIGGTETRPDWPRMGPSLLIATCLIVAIRTARWPATLDSTARDLDLDHEITFAATLTHYRTSIFGSCVTYGASVRGALSLTF